MSKATCKLWPETKLRGEATQAAVLRSWDIQKASRYRSSHEAGTHAEWGRGGHPGAESWPDRALSVTTWQLRAPSNNNIPRWGTLYHREPGITQLSARIIAHLLHKPCTKLTVCHKIRSFSTTFCDIVLVFLYLFAHKSTIIIAIKTWNRAGQQGLTFVQNKLLVVVRLHFNDWWLQKKLRNSWTGNLNSVSCVRCCARNT